MKKFMQRFGFGVVALVVPALALSAPAGTYDDITAAVDFAEVATAVVAIAALLAIALVAKKGARLVLGMIGR